jgi:hypothetical protein
LTFFGINITTILVSSQLPVTSCQFQTGTWLLGAGN